MSIPKPRLVRSVSSDTQLAPEILKVLIQSATEPLVVKGQLKPWLNSRSWTANEILDTLEFTSLTTFKIFPRRETPLYKSRTGGRKGAVFETDCIYVEGHYEHLKDWISENYRENELESCQDIESASVKGEKCLGEDVHTIEEVMCGTQTPKSKRRCLRSEKLLHSDTGKDTEEMCLLDRSNPNPLLEYPRSQYWVYADYKYLCNIHRDSPEKTFSEVDWSIFGLGEQDWKDSVLWIGSEGAYTPCHYDTYGYNLVAQLAGEKKWTLFSPSDSVNLYPTRVPYEESSVFSEVDVVDPDYVQYPRHRDATPYQVVLKEGDLLTVPRHWWHHVETVGSVPSVSINTWIELPSDSDERIKEVLVRTLVSAFVSGISAASSSDLINPNEQIFSNEENLHFLFLAIEKDKKSLQPHDQPTTESVVSPAKEEHKEDLEINLRHFLKALTSNTVLETLTEALINVDHD